MSNKFGRFVKVLGFCFVYYVVPGACAVGLFFLIAKIIKLCLY